MLRLSSIAGEKLTKGNPGITDLGDPNRPMKISERYGELYDNEWTDVMVKVDLIKQHFPDLEQPALEEIIVRHLYRTLMVRKNNPEQQYLVKHTVYVEFSLNFAMIFVLHIDSKATDTFLQNSLNRRFAVIIWFRHVAILEKIVYNICINTYMYIDISQIQFFWGKAVVHTYLAYTRALNVNFRYI